ncbi:unnamed protein product [Cercopithifilaria johnstoni]|uniref:Uncharacterized protein n=1 Tax=Cercopithifilaria johnstoni TaxID=2874296 RepID=A0A8J2QAQ4_9BILA|nr:unnamed protein product [Cercopithifilaria johnstoni]
MLLLLILLSIIGIAYPTALPKQNISSTVKNETGKGHWYPPPMSPMYGEISPFSYPNGYHQASSGYYPYTSCYPPASCDKVVPLALDQFYCSAHGSFALETGSPSNKLMREFCRFTATSSENSCSTCCKIAARHYTTSADEVSGIIFTFDPNTPPIHTHPRPQHASLLRKKRTITTPTETNPIKSAIKMQNSVNLANSPGLLPISGVTPSNDIPQCFCCAPVTSIHSF